MPNDHIWQGVLGGVTDALRDYMQQRNQLAMMQLKEQKEEELRFKQRGEAKEDLEEQRAFEEQKRKGMETEYKLGQKKYQDASTPIAYSWDQKQGLPSPETSQPIKRTGSEIVSGLGDLSPGQMRGADDLMKFEEAINSGNFDELDKMLDMELTRSKIGATDALKTQRLTTKPSKPPKEPTVKIEGKDYTLPDLQNWKARVESQKKFYDEQVIEPDYVPTQDEVDEFKLLNRQLQELNVAIDNFPGNEGKGQQPEQQELSAVQQEAIKILIQEDGMSEEEATAAVKDLQ